MPKHSPRSPHLGLSNMRSSKGKRDWHEIMLYACVAVVAITVFLQNLMQKEEIQNLKEDLNTCQFYQEFVIDQL